MRLITALLLFAVLTTATGAYADAPDLLNLHKSETNIIGVSSKNRDTLIAYIQGQQSVADYHPEYVLVINLKFAGVDRQIAYKTIEDIPYQSVSTECPTAHSNDKRTCWFIKYTDIPDQATGNIGKGWNIPYYGSSQLNLTY